MITQDQIEEMGVQVADARTQLSIATQRLNESLIKYWYQETGAVDGEKYVYTERKGGQEVVFSGFSVKYGRMNVILHKVKKDGTKSEVGQWNMIDSLELFKSTMTKV